MERDRQAEDARIQKKEADDADEMTVIPRVEFHAARYERTQRRRIDFVIEHRQSPPFRREKFSRLRLDSSHSESVPLRSSLNQKSPQAPIFRKVGSLRWVRIASSVQSRRETY